MLDAARCRRIIAASFPEIEIETPRYFAEGWDYELWEIEGGLLFRFPKRAETADPLRREARLLARLAGVLSVPIPRPLYVSEGNRQFPQPFFGYAKLPGTPLEDVPPSEASRTPLVKALADFLEELHGVPPATAAAWGVPCYTADAWREVVQRLSRDGPPGRLTPAVERRTGRRRIVLARLSRQRPPLPL